jgi:hypothetical protein
MQFFVGAGAEEKRFGSHGPADSDINGLARSSIGRIISAWRL